MNITRSPSAQKQRQYAQNNVSIYENVLNRNKLLIKVLKIE